MLVSLKNVCDEALKNINFIKSQPLSTHLFHILCDKMERKYTEVLWGHTKVQWLSQGKDLCHHLRWKVNYRLFCVEHYFHVKEQVTNYDYSNLGMWQTFSQN